jgi:hypothetical protein
MTWHVVYWTATGEADSFGTVLADPMPAEFSVKALTEAETQMLVDGTGIWNPATLSVESRPVDPEVDE